VNAQRSTSVIFRFSAIQRLNEFLSSLESTFSTKEGKYVHLLCHVNCNAGWDCITKCLLTTVPFVANREIHKTNYGERIRPRRRCEHPR